MRNILKVHPSKFDWDGQKIINEGMDLRDYFANSAMQAICTNAGRNGFNFQDADVISKQAYKIADVMLKQREL